MCRFSCSRSSSRRSSSRAPRWRKEGGDRRVAGLLAGLPLTSGPVSVFLAVELGRAFAVQSARGTILGMVAMSAFCVAYARGAAGLSWPPDPGARRRGLRR